MRSGQRCVPFELRAERIVACFVYISIAELRIGLTVSNRRRMTVQIHAGLADILLQGKRINAGSFGPRHLRYIHPTLRCGTVEIRP